MKPRGRTKERKTHEEWGLPTIVRCFGWDSSIAAPDRPADLTVASPDTRRSTLDPDRGYYGEYPARLRRGYGGAAGESACGPGEQDIRPETANNPTNLRKCLKIRELCRLLRSVGRRADTQPYPVRLPSFTRRSTGSAASRDRARSTSNSATQSLCSSGSTSICWTRQARLSSEGST